MGSDPPAPSSASDTSLLQSQCISVLAVHHPDHDHVWHGEDGDEDQVNGQYGRTWGNQTENSSHSSQRKDHDDDLIASFGTIHHAVFGIRIPRDEAPIVVPGMPEREIHANADQRVNRNQQERNEKGLYPLRSR